MSKGLIGGLVIVGILLVFGLVMAGKYNSLITNDEKVTGQWAQVENQYQRRFDLIPNLVATVKGYADFEKETLTAVTEARARALGAMANSSGGQNLGELENADRAVGVAMGRFFGYTENYPELKANQNFLNLQAQLEGTENRVATERMRYNEVVKDFNTTVKRFPTNMVAGMFGFDQREYFESATGSEEAPQVSFE
jgi:LemA protein